MHFIEITAVYFFRFEFSKNVSMVCSCQGTTLLISYVFLCPMYSCKYCSTENFDHGLAFSDVTLIKLNIPVNDMVSSDLTTLIFITDESISYQKNDINETNESFYIIFSLIINPDNNDK